MTAIRSIKKNFLSLKQWKDFKPIMNRFHMERFQERQQVTKSENVKHFVVVKLRKVSPDNTSPVHHRCSTIEVQRSLIKPDNYQCFYYDGNDPFLQIGPIKAEILSDEPRIVQFYDIISDSEIEMIKTLSRKMLQPSQLRDDLDDAHQIRPFSKNSYSICDWSIEKYELPRALSSLHHFEK